MKNENEKLNKVLEMITAGIVTQSEIEQFLVVVLDVIKKSKDNFETISSENLAKIEQVVAYISQEHKKVLSEIDTKQSSLKKEVLNKLSLSQKEFDSKIKEANNVIKELQSITYQDGKDADEEVIVSKVLEKLPKQEVESPESIKDKLESLSEEERLDVKAIKGIELYSTKENLDFALGVLDQRTQYLINKRSGNGVQSIVAGANITVDNTDPLNPIISSTAGGTGTVTSVGMTVPTGLTVSGSPVTTSGTLAVSLDTGYVIPLQTTLDGFVPYTGATQDVDLGAFGIELTEVRANSSAGILLESNNGTDIGILGVGNTANIEWYGSHNFSTATQDTLAGFIGSGKTLSSITVGTGLTLTGSTLSVASGTITGSGANTQITYWTGTSTIAGSSAFTWNDTTKVFRVTNGGSPAKRALQVDALNFDVTMGDTNGGANRTFLAVSDSGQNIEMYGWDGATIGSVFKITTDINAGVLAYIGDVTGLKNGTLMFLDDDNSDILFTLDRDFLVRSNTSTITGLDMRLSGTPSFQFGDTSGVTSSAENIGKISFLSGVTDIFGVYDDGISGFLGRIFTADNTGVYIGDIDGSVNGTVFQVDDVNVQYVFSDRTFDIRAVKWIFPTSNGLSGSSFVATDDIGTTEFARGWVNLFQQVDTVTVANTATATTIIGTGSSSAFLGGSVTMPADYPVEGSKYRVKASGTFGTTSNPSIEFVLKFYGTNVATVTSGALSGVAAGRAWEAEFELVRNSSNRFEVQGSVRFNVSSGVDQVYYVANTSTINVTTTSAADWDLTVEWQSADPLNTITSRILSIDQES